jgi:uncharacterized membrane protein YkvA (DUF1232 family)
MSRGRLGLYGLAAAYVLAPIDVMPELLLAVLGLADDAILSVWLLGSFLDETERFLIWEGRARVVPGTLADQSGSAGYPEDQRQHRA